MPFLEHYYQIGMEISGFSIRIGDTKFHSAFILSINSIVVSFVRGSWFVFRRTFLGGPVYWGEKRFSHSCRAVAHQRGEEDHGHGPRAPQEGRALMFTHILLAAAKSLRP